MTALLLLLSVFAAGVPMVAYLLLLRWLDRYEREPLSLVGAAFGWGAVGAVVLSLIGSTILGLPLYFAFGEGALDVAGPVVLAPLVEEPAKALLLLLLVRSRHFDNATDGFVYGAACGLGFGMTENFLYFTQGAMEGLGAWVGLVVIRTLFSGLLHACCTSLVGAALGYTKFRGAGEKALLVPLALVVAMGMHAFWNGVAVISGTVDGAAPLLLVGLLSVIVEFWLLFAIFQASLASESRLIRAELADEARQGTLPTDHAARLASWRERIRAPKWLPAGLSPQPYIELATLLAFRRQQARARPHDAWHQHEVARLRHHVRWLCAQAGAAEWTEASADREPRA